jgi:ubiquinone biosynthesis protein
MNAGLFKFIYKPMTNWAAHRALVGRNRSGHEPEKGRFTAAEVRDLVTQTWRTIDAVTPNKIQEPTFGSRMNVRLAGLTLAFFRNLTALGVEREYAIALIGDVCWKIYRWWGYVGLFARSLSQSDAIRDQLKRVGSDGSWPISFPFNPPGYRTRYMPTDNGLGFDVIRCPVAEYFRAHGAADLGVGTWCMLDYPLAETQGIRLVRTQTLAAGDKQCDFRWFRAAKPSKR